MELNENELDGSQPGTKSFFAFFSPLQGAVNPIFNCPHFKTFFVEPNSVDSKTF
jgi:hypothetical protein